MCLTIAIDTSSPHLLRIPVSHHGHGTGSVNLGGGAGGDVRAHTGGFGQDLGFGEATVGASGCFAGEVFLDNPVEGGGRSVLGTAAPSFAAGAVFWVGVNVGIAPGIGGTSSRSGSPAVGGGG